MMQANIEVLIRSVWFVFLGVVAAIAPGAGPAVLGIFIAKEDLGQRDFTERYFCSLIGVVVASTGMYGALSLPNIASVMTLTGVFWGKYLYWKLSPVQRVSRRHTIPHW